MMNDVTAADESLGSQAVASVLWTATQKWVARIGGFVTVAILARLLSPAEFGTVAAATAVLPIAYLLADMGFSTYVVQAKEIHQRMLSTAFWFAIVVGTLLGGGLVLAAPIFAWMFHVPEAADVVRSLAPLVLLVALSSVSVALLRRQMRFRTLAVQSFIASILGQVIAIAMALLGFGVWALVGQMILFQVVTTIYACVSARWLPGPTFSVTEFFRMASFGIKVVGVDLVGVLRQWVEYALISAFVGASGLGYLNVAQRLVQIAQDVTGAAVLPVSTVFFARVRTSPDRLRDGYRRALGLTYAVIVPVMVFLAVSGTQLIPLLFGAQWQGSILPSQILAIAGILTMIAMLDHGAFYGLGRPGTWFVFAVLVDGAMVVMAYFVAPHGLVAWCMGVLVVTIVATLVRWPLIARVLSERWSRIAIISGRAVLCGLIGALAGWGVGMLTTTWTPALSIGLTGAAVLGGHLLSMYAVMRPQLRDAAGIVRTRIQRVVRRKETS